MSRPEVSFGANSRDASNVVSAASCRRTVAGCHRHNGWLILYLLLGWPLLSPGGEVDWLPEVQRPPAESPQDVPLLSTLLMDTAGQPITTLDGWKQRREELCRWWLDFLGPVSRQRMGSTCFEILAEDTTDGVLRQLIRYEVEPGVPVEAYLLKPIGGAERRPGVVVLHSTVNYTIRQPAGLEGPPEKWFGLKLARRGYVAICPRCFLWTDDLSIGYQQHVEAFRAKHPESRGMARMLYDAVAAVDILAAQPDVDAKRLGAVGHSLGAKEVLYLAAFDERIRAAVSSEGGVGTSFSNWDATWYLGPDVRQPGFGHEHHELLALAAPRAFLLIGGDSADGAKSWPFIEAAMPVYRLYGGRPQLGLLNHGQGHAVPPIAEERIQQWLDAALVNDE